MHNKNPVNLLIFSGIGSADEQFHRTHMKSWRALGPSKVKRQLEQNGFTCQIINFATVLSYKDLLKISEPFVDKKTIIGISTTFLSGDYNSAKSYEILKNVVSTVKSKFKNKVLLGGPNPDSYKEQFSADFTLSGYSENTVVDLFNRIANNGIQRVPKKQWDILTCSHKWSDNDYIVRNETLPLEIGRGCIYSCKYCKFEMLGKKRGEYVRDMSLIRDELIENHERWNTTNYMLMDDTFNDDPYKIDEWCKMLDTLDFKIQYTAYCRADLLYKYQDHARNLYLSGMVGSTLGIETLNLTAAKAIGKVWSGKHAREFVPKFVHEICEGKTLTQINFIMGLPGDTIADVWDWIKWAEDNKLPTLHAQPLIIRPPKLFPNDAIYSDFDKNAMTNYGYRIPRMSRPQMWENDNMSYFKARQEYKKVYKYVSEHFSDLAWHGFASLSLGYTVDDILSTTLDKLYSSEEYKDRSENFFKEYIGIANGTIV